MQNFVVSFFVYLFQSLPSVCKIHVSCRPALHHEADNDDDDEWTSFCKVEYYILVTWMQ